MLRMLHTTGVLTAAPLWLLFLCCVVLAQGKSSGFAVEHVTILPMTVNGAPIANATLLVVDGRIAEIGPADMVQVPKAMSRINGRGHWLMPGLADMHVHTLNRAYGRFVPGGTDFPPDYVQTADVMLPFIANGVTQILEMSALPETLRQRHEIDSGAVLGPHIAAAAMLDGDPPVWQLNARVATTPEQGRRAVREIAAAGYAFVKIYTRLEMPVFQAVIEEGRAVGLPVIGHVPAGSRGRAEDVLVPGFAMVAHAEEFAKLDPESGDHIRHYAQFARRSGTWITSTLTTNDWIARQTRDPSIVSSASGIEHVHPALIGQWLHANRYTANFSQELAERRENLLKYAQRLVRVFFDEGVPIMPGTDSIIPGVVYGFSLHDELELLAAAGIGNQQVLESATRLPAEFLRVADDRGTIEVGKMADFILLAANPVDDVRNTRAIAGVSIRGRYLPRAELGLLMSDLAQRYRKMPPVMRP